MLCSRCVLSSIIHHGVDLSDLHTLLQVCPLINHTPRNILQWPPYYVPGVSSHQSYAKEYTSVTPILCFRCVLSSIIHQGIYFNDPHTLFQMCPLINLTPRNILQWPPYSVSGVSSHQSYTKEYTSMTPILCFSCVLSSIIHQGIYFNDPHTLFQVCPLINHTPRYILQRPPYSVSGV